MIVIADARRGLLGTAIAALWISLVGCLFYAIWQIAAGELSGYYGWQLLLMVALPVAILPKQTIATRAFLHRRPLLFVEGGRLIQSDPRIFAKSTSAIVDFESADGKLIILTSGRTRRLPGWLIVGGPESAVANWQTWREKHVGS